VSLGSTQPLTEMSTRNLPGGKGHKAGDFTAICEPRRLTTVWASTACYRQCNLCVYTTLFLLDISCLVATRFCHSEKMIYVYRCLATVSCFKRSNCGVTVVNNRNVINGFVFVCVCICVCIYRPTHKRYGKFVPVLN
jgi:hypothetical protein